MGFLSLRKCRRILKESYALHVRRRAELSPLERTRLEQEMEQLDAALLAGRRKEAAPLARRLSAFYKERFPKPLWRRFLEGVGALAIALLIAFCIRQFWFELYEVPTGSMRPTIRETDHLLVSKTTFGFSVPFVEGLTDFREAYLLRNGMVIFTIDNMEVSDPYTLYFHLFRGKKRLVKRCLAKGGDWVYFYGGRLYGIDASGRPLTELWEASALEAIGIEKIDHVPYITPEGRVQWNKRRPDGLYSSATFSQMGEPRGRMVFEQNGTSQGFFFQKSWQEDRPAALKEPHSAPVSYSELFGMGNFASARLVSQGEGFALELQHTPYLTSLLPEMQRGGNRPLIAQMQTTLPLHREHLDRLQQNLYTGRFWVREGRAYRYSEAGLRKERNAPVLSIPNGCYEFYYGRAYRVYWGGILHELPEDHPIYDQKWLPTLFNYGFSFQTVPGMGTQRFAYFREGALYVMGGAIFLAEDAVLQQFIKEEEVREATSSVYLPYYAFKDRGPPVRDGVVDVEFLHAFGLRIPEGHFLALGDNFAMSGDSRDFGFVPESNLRGSPLALLWPFGKRWGEMPQTPASWWRVPNLVVFVIVTVVIVGWMWYWRVARRTPVLKNKE